MTNRLYLRSCMIFVKWSCNTKDRTIINQSFVVYELMCIRCDANYVGKNRKNIIRTTG